MAFWSRKEKRATLAAPPEWLKDALGGTPSASGKRVNQRTALGIAPVWAAVSLIAEQIGQLPLKVYKTTDDDSTIEARQHRAWPILHDAPNEYTPADRFWSTVATQLLLWGNAFLEKRRSPTDGLVNQLYLLDPSRMVVTWDGRDKLFKYQRNQTETTTGATIAGNEVIYTTDEVLHIFGLSIDGICGQSVIQNCRNAFGSAMSRDEYEGGFWARGATLSGVIEHPGPLSDKAHQHLKDSAQIIYGGSDRAHQIGVFEEGAQFKTVSNPLRDLQFVESQQLTRTDIAVMFKLPPNYLGGASGDSLTYTTVEMNQLHFALHAIAPWTNTIAKALSNDPGLMPQSVHHCEFMLEAMLRGDTDTRGKFYKTMSDIGAITKNEVRERENLPPMPGGDDPQPTITERISETTPPVGQGAAPPTPPTLVPVPNQKAASGQ